MQKRIIILVALLFCPNLLVAEQKFECGDASITIEVTQSEKVNYLTNTVLTVEKDNVQTKLVYQNIDFIGGHCVTNSKGYKRVLFQAYCGGSSPNCRDLDNWGIVNPTSLRVLLVPNNTNRDEAKRILGVEQLERPPMLSIEKEKIRLGIPLI